MRNLSLFFLFLIFCNTLFADTFPRYKFLDTTPLKETTATIDLNDLGRNISIEYIRDLYETYKNSPESVEFILRVEFKYSLSDMDFTMLMNHANRVSVGTESPEDLIKYINHSLNIKASFKTSPLSDINKMPWMSKAAYQADLKFNGYESWTYVYEQFTSICRICGFKTDVFEHPNMIARQYGILAALKSETIKGYGNNPKERWYVIKDINGNKKAYALFWLIDLNGKNSTGKPISCLYPFASFVFSLDGTLYNYKNVKTLNFDHGYQL